MNEQPTEGSPAGQGGWPKGYVAALWASVGLYALWTIWHLGSSTLWLDETLTAWITSGDLRTCFDRAWHYQGQSPLFFVLVWCVRQVFGSSELALRSLSLLAVAGSVVTFRAVLNQTVWRRDSWIGAITLAVVLLSHPEVLNSHVIVGVSARPYALAIWASLLSLYGLLRWIDRPSMRTWLLYVAATSLTILLHYIFATVLLLHLVVVLRCGLKNRRVVSGSVAAVAAVGVCLLPAVPHVLLVAQKSKLYTTSVPPTVMSTFMALVSPAGVLTALCLGLVLHVVKGGQSLRETAREFAPGLCWWMIAPLGILLIYQVTGVCVNVPRYYLWRVPAAGLIVIAAVRVAGSYRQVALPVVLVVSFVLPALRAPEATGWKEAFAWGQQYPATDFEPVVYSGLIESSNASCVEDDGFREYMLAPLWHYTENPDGHVLPMRLRRSEELFGDTLAGLLQSHDGLVFYLSRLPAVGDEVRQQAELAGHELIAHRMTEDVEVVVTRRLAGMSKAPQLVSATARSWIRRNSEHSVVRLNSCESSYAQ